MRDETVIEIRPRKQFRAFLETTKRWSCLIVHRRGGKTYAALQKLLQRALTHQRPGPPKRYAYIAPTQTQAKDISWAYLKDFTSGIPGTEKNEAELKVTFSDGMTIRLYSGENYERMRGLYFDGVIIDEPEDIDPEAWNQVIRPCLSDYQGWAIWIGTVKGKRGIWRRFLDATKNPKWFTLLLKASESGIIPREELEDIRENTSESAFQQEYECDPNIGRPGAIYAKEVSHAEAEGRVKRFDPDKGALVHTTWDLGSPENTVVIYWQRVGPWLYIIDHDAGLRLTTGERVAHMLAKGYNYGNHCLPHDGAAKNPGGLSFLEELMAAGLQNVCVIPRTDDPERRINRMWEMFPNIYFNEPTTADLLAALEAYHRKEDVKNATIETRIVHDWASHHADAFGYIAEAELAGIVAQNLPRLAANTGKKRVKVTFGEKPDEDDDDGFRAEYKAARSFRKIRVTR